MKKSFVIGAIALVCSLNAFAKEECASRLYDIQTPADYDHKKFAPLPVERLYQDAGFIASVDDASDGTLNVGPDWISYELKGYYDGEYPESWERPSRWYRLPIFDLERDSFGIDKAIDDSYRGVGRIYNRGHLAQRSDLSRMSPEAGCNSHVFANAIPQFATMNQGIWLANENIISSLANEKGQVWISAGPIFGTKHKIGDDDEIPVRVPTEIWKTVTWIQDGKIQWRAFIYPNIPAKQHPNFKSGNCSRDKRYDHTPFIVSLKDIEDATGLTMLPQIQGEYRDAMLSFRHTDLPEIDNSNYIGSCR